MWHTLFLSTFCALAIIPIIAKQDTQNSKQDITQYIKQDNPDSGVTLLASDSNLASNSQNVGYKYSSLFMLEQKLDQLQSIMNDEACSASQVQKLQKLQNCFVPDCQALCENAGIDSRLIDWESIQLFLNKEEGSSPACTRTICTLKSNINTILQKACDILAGGGGGGGGSCGIPVKQADLPLVIAAGTDDGKRYFLTESIVITGQAAPSITITASGVTFDLCGFTITHNTNTAPIFEISGNQVIVKNGHLYSTGTTASPIDVLSAAKQTLLENLHFMAVTGSAPAGGTIRYAGDQTLIRNVSMYFDISGAAPAIARDTAATATIGMVDIDGFDLYYNSGSSGGGATGDAIAVEGRSTIKNSIIRFEDAGALIATGVHVQSNGVAGQSAAVIDNVVVQISGTNVGNTGLLLDYLSVGDLLLSYMIKDSTVYTNAIGINVVFDPGTTSGTRFGAIVNSRVEGAVGATMGIRVSGNVTEVRDNQVINCNIGYLFTATNLTAERNSADACTAISFSMDGVNQIIRQNTALGIGGSGTGYVVSATSSGISVEENDSVNHGVGFSDPSPAPPGSLNFFASNYAAHIGFPGSQYSSTGFFTGGAGVNYVAGIAAAASYWMNVEGP